MNPFEAIPDETPIDDISGLKVTGIRHRSELNNIEAQNILKAQIKYLAATPSDRQAPFTAKWMKRLHEEMFGDVWKWAGEFRQSNKSIGIDWPLVEQAVHELAEDIKAWSGSSLDPVVASAQMHHRSVSIHPFENGNGRWSRMLANIWLKKHGCPVVSWPEAHVGTESAIRGEYIEAIKQADRGDLGPLEALHRRFQ